MEQRELDTAIPVTRILHPLEPVQLGMSLQYAVARMRDNSCSAIPVISDSGHLIGVLEDIDILKSLEAGKDLNASISEVMWREATKVNTNTDTKRALSLLLSSESSVLIVNDQNNYPIGIITAADLISESPSELRPKIVGGMATPLGVYLTNGAYIGGAPTYALILTGAFLFTLYLASSILSVSVIEFASTKNMLPVNAIHFSGFISLILFCVLLRLSPLTGTHAAEHMVVHAIERGEKLTFQTVSRMPRAHPRCGTNLAVGLGIFLWLSNSGLFRDKEISVLFAALVALILWKPLGILTQQFITTKTPTKKQIENGIIAGKQLIKKYQKQPIYDPPFYQKILSSGILQIIIGSTLTYFVADLILHLLNVPKLM